MASGQKLNHQRASKGVNSNTRLSEKPSKTNCPLSTCFCLGAINQTFRLTKKLHIIKNMMEQKLTRGDYWEESDSSGLEGVLKECLW
jgi:hypothetical protein